MTGVRAAPHSEVAVAMRAAIAVVGFAVYAAAVATWPLEPDPVGRSSAAAHGTESAAADAWRAAGCQVCHSVFGLGGHIGPDLTNVVSRTSTGYVRAMVRAGPPGMPAYRDLDEGTLDLLAEYLERVDRAARYPSSSWAGDRSEDRP